MAMNPRLLVPRAVYDPDAAKYLAAVEAADGQALETPVKRAIDGFIRDCKAAGIFDAIKASCILCGARTLSGALVPLKGTAPTNNNFVAADYNRETGLVGNGSTKYLDSNRATNADPATSMHIAVYPTTIGTTTLRATGSFQAGGSDETMIMSGDVRCRTVDTLSNVTVAANAIYGVSRSSNTAWYARGAGTDFPGATSPSATPNTRNHFVFGYNNAGSLFGASNARLAFYSIGESIDLEALDDAVSALVTAIGAAI